MICLGSRFTESSMSFIGVCLVAANWDEHWSNSDEEKERKVYS